VYEYKVKGATAID